MKAEYRDKEHLTRMLLYHRFDLVSKTTEIDGKDYSIENLPFNSAIRELKRTYEIFNETNDFQEKINYLISQAFLMRHHRILEKDSAILIDQISRVIFDFYTADYFDHIEEILKKRDLLIVPIKTMYAEDKESITPLGANRGEPVSEIDTDTDNARGEPPYSTHEHIKAIVIFDERLLKINRRENTKKLGLRIYRIQYAPITDLLNIMNIFLNSFDKPLDSNWDKELNALLHAEKINHITKKELQVGNGSWLTAKMLILAATYATLFQYCKSQGLKELEAESISIHIAEGIYKLFIVFDRNLAIREYLEMHGFPKSHETLSVMHRLDTINEFLSGKGNKRFPADKQMLEGIYTKSLNWLLADYLKKGDIGEAHALIESEAGNLRWNPLIYAAKNGKIAIAELLGSNPRYMNSRDKLGNLPIHYAVTNGHFDICNVLVRYRNKNDLDLASKDQNGNTPLHLAVLHNHMDILDLLLHHAPQLLNLQNDSGATALKLACDHHHISIIKKLISIGANLEGIDLSHYSDEIQIQLKKAGRKTLL